MSLYTSDATSDDGALPPSMPTLRPATVDDVEAIATVWHSAWIDGHLGHVPAALLPHRQLDDFRRRTAAELDATTVATTRAGVVGFVTVGDDEVEQLFVAASGRGTGIAAALLRHGEQLIATRHRRAWLAVVAGNARARRFYERNGWRDTGPFDHAAPTAAGAIVVPCRRYEKVLAVGRRPATEDRPRHERNR